MNNAKSIRHITTEIERAVARATGKFGSVQAAVRGLHGVFKRLSEEHKELATLLKWAAVTTDVDKRKELWPTIRDSLIAHEQAELQDVYADFAWHPSLIDIVHSHEEDAAKLQASVRELDSLACDSPNWQPTLLKVEALVNAHAEREEELFFPHIQKTIGKDRAEELDLRYVETKKAIQDIS